ncbi:MAG TPA: MarR family transcriptional regulator [Steroidobacter sp.]
MSKHYDVKHFTTGTSIGYLMKMAYTLLHERLTEAFADREINFMQWIVLMKLREGAELSASELCRALRHDTGAFTRLVDQLEERGLIERERSQTDRRVVRLSLTPAGRKLATGLLPVLVEHLNFALADFSKAEFQELCRLLNKLIGRLKEAESSSEARA